MSIDSDCYELVSGAGLEPILSPKFRGGRGQASGFIMRMMAENKKKHKGEYRNPSDNDYNSTMKEFRAFDYKKLANPDQNGKNTSDYGASPFIMKHFGNVDVSALKQNKYKKLIEESKAKTEEILKNREKERLKGVITDAEDKLKSKVKNFLTGRVQIRKAKKIAEAKAKTKSLSEAKKKKDEDYELEYYEKLLQQLRDAKDEEKILREYQENKDIYGIPKKEYYKAPTIMSYDDYRKELDGLVDDLEIRTKLLSTRKPKYSASEMRALAYKLGVTEDRVGSFNVLKDNKSLYDKARVMLLESSNSKLLFNTLKKIKQLKDKIAQLKETSRS